MFGKLDMFDIIKIFFRVLVTVIVAAVFVVLFWRMATSRVPETLLTLSPNDALCEAYEREGDELFVFSQAQNSITRTEKNYGYFTVCEAVLIPSAEQVQLLIRYNDSTLKALKTDYALDFDPDPAESWYDVTLVTATDLTPENGEDNLTNDRESVLLTRVQPSEVSAAEHHGRHSYRRLVFDGICVDELLLALYADFYYVGDIAYQKPDSDIYKDEAYGTLLVYAYTENADNVRRPITDADREALAR